MGTRFKLRVCTWNVGNAQPRADLSPWLGIGKDDYDIIAVGAQEANFGTEKTLSPTSVASPATETSDLTIDGEECLQGSPSAPGQPTSSRRFRKISRALWGSKNTKQDDTPKKHRTKLDIPVEASRESNLDNAICDSDSDSGHGKQPIPKSTATFPLRNARGPSDSDLRKGQSFAVETVSFVDFMDKKTCDFQFDNLDESLLIKRRQEPSEEVGKLYSVDDPLGNKFLSSRHDSTNDVSEQNGEWSSDGNKEAEALDRERVPQLPQTRRSRRLRQSVSSFLRPGDEQSQTEAVEESPSSTTGEKKFSRVVEKNMPGEYHLIAKHHLMEIKLLLFIHDRHKSRVVKTEAVTEATGIGNVVGNKGAVAVKLTLDDTTFCFVSSHLAAHEGAKFLAQRNMDVVEIMRNIEKNRVHGLPVIHEFNHIFWMGDLNYRLDLKHLLPAAVTWSHEERWAYVSDLIGQKRYADLSSFDELRREMEAERVFAGFVEGKLEFPPTFKVVRGKGGAEYQGLRVPSYCDRILWHSLPLHRNHVKLREYGCAGAVDTSDHKPVYAVFDLVMPKPIRVYGLPAPRDTLKCTMDFVSLRVSGLYEKRVIGESDERVRYEVLEDGALGVSPQAGGRGAGAGAGAGWGGSGRDGERTPSSAHTRRVVTATFRGGGLFVKERPHRAEVPLRDGRRECRYDELPAIALRPVGSLADLTYKYVTIVFARLGSRQGSSCVLPVARLVQTPGRHRVGTELTLTKYGMGVAKVFVEVELVVSLETWIDTRNKVVRPRFR